VRSRSEEQERGAPPIIRPNAAERFLDPVNAVLLTLFVPTYFIVSVSVHIQDPHTVLCLQKSVSEVQILTVYAVINATCK
jgi:hypothetical protein